MGYTVTWERPFEFSGTFWVVKLNGNTIGWTNDEECSVEKMFPDPWADDAAAWRLQKWLHTNGCEVNTRPLPSGKSEVFVGTLFGDFIHQGVSDTMNAALCAAALAWIEAQKQNESQRCGEHASKPEAGGKAERE